MKGLPTLLTLFTRPRPPVGTTPADVVHAENKWRLLRYRPRPEGVRHATPVLLVPSLWPETFGYVAPEAMLRGIPVLASNIGGLPEAKLGVDYLLPVTPAGRVDGGYVSPPQDTTPWAAALKELLSNPQAYEGCARRSRGCTCSSRSPRRAPCTATSSRRSPGITAAARASP